MDNLQMLVNQTLVLKGKMREIMRELNLIGYYGIRIEEFPKEYLQTVKPN
jgi:hypothetical protein